jgi:sec-independent protein translocase protein TatA
MGLRGISLSELLVILTIVMLIFGTKRLKNIGGDLGGALQSFRKAINGHDDTLLGEQEKPVGRVADK